MTESDWILLTNRPDVVEKDIIKLLDWFIKEGFLLHFLLFSFNNLYHSVLITMIIIIMISVINTFVSSRIFQLEESVSCTSRVSSQPAPLEKNWLKLCSEY